jgi:hypothetical protein
VDSTAAKEAEANTDEDNVDADKLLSGKIYPRCTKKLYKARASRSAK